MQPLNPTNISESQWLHNYPLPLDMGFEEIEVKVGQVRRLLI